MNSRKLVTLNALLRRTRERLGGIVEYSEFRRAADAVSTGLTTKDTASQMIYLFYKYPEFAKQYVSHACIEDEEYQDAAIRLYRRILHGGYAFDIKISDYFEIGDGQWCAPWCVGYLSTRIIRHVDIPTFFCDDTEIVSATKLLYADKYANSVPDDIFEDDEISLNLMEDDLFDESGEDDCTRDVDALCQQIADAGIIMEFDIPAVCAQICHIQDDPLRDYMPYELDMLHKEYVFRVKASAAYISNAMGNDVQQSNLTRFVNLIMDANPKTLLEHMTQPCAKFCFVVYQLFIQTEEDKRVAMASKILYNYLHGDAAIVSIVLTDCWEMYGSFPLTIMGYLSGDVRLEDVTKEMKKEFFVKGSKQFLEVSETVLYNPSSPSATRPFFNIVSKWQEVCPVFVSSIPSTDFSVKTKFFHDRYPGVIYDYPGVTSSPMALSFMRDTDLWKRIWTPMVFIRERYTFSRTPAQAALCLSFALRVAIPRSSMDFPLVDVNEDVVCLTGTWCKLKHDFGVPPIIYRVIRTDVPSPIKRGPDICIACVRKTTIFKDKPMPTTDVCTCGRAYELMVAPVVIEVD